MKTLTLLFAILIFSLTSFGQLKEVKNLEDEDKVLGVSFSVDTKSIERRSDFVTFLGVVYAYKNVDNKREEDEAFRIVSFISANCKTFVWSQHTRKGQWGLTEDKLPNLIDEKDTNMNQLATAGNPIFDALVFVCKDKPLSKTDG